MGTLKDPTDSFTSVLFLGSKRDSVKMHLNILIHSFIWSAEPAPLCRELISIQEAVGLIKRVPHLVLQVLIVTTATEMCVASVTNN